MKNAITLIMALFVVLSSALASQKKEISLSYDRSNEVVWAGNAAYETHKNKAYELKFLAYQISEAYKRNPKADPTFVLNIANEFTKEFRKLKSGRPDLIGADAMRSVETLYGILAKVPGAANVFGPFELAHSAASHLYSESLSDDRQILAQIQLANRVKSISEINDQVWADLYLVGQSLPKAGVLIDTVFGPAIGASVEDDAAKILATNPEFDAYQLLRKALGPDGRISTSLEDIQDVFASETAALREIMHTSGEAIQELDREQKSLAASILARDQERTLLEERARAEQERRVVDNTKLAASKSSLFILSTVAGFIDPEAGRAIQVLGSSAFQMADAMSRYRETILAAGRSAESVQNLAATVLTGEFLSAGLQLLSLVGVGVGVGGPSLEQQIRDQVVEMRRDLQVMAKSLHTRFDRVDQSLNEILATMQREFMRIEQGMDEVRGVLAGVRRSLLVLESQMSQLERNLNETIESGFKRGFLLDRTKCLELSNYVQRSKMPFTQYSECLATFADYATNVSRDSLSTSKLNELSDTAIMSAVSRNSIEKNIGVLAAIAEKRFGNFGMNSGRKLANPVEWAIGAEAYLALAKAQSENQRLTNSSGLDEMISTGNDILQSLRGITALRTSKGLQPSFAFFSSLVGFYRAKADALVNEITGEKRKLELNSLEGTKGLDIWNPQKELSYAVPQTIPHCNPQSNWKEIELPGLPERYLDSITYADKALLHMSDERLSVCYDFSTTKPQCKLMGTAFWSADCNAELTISVSAKLGTREILRRTAVVSGSPLFTIVGDSAQRTNYINFAANERYYFMVKHNWGAARPWSANELGGVRTKPALNLQANFMGLSREELSLEQRAAGEKLLSAELSARMLALKNRVVNQSSERIRTALDELTGARLLLSQYVQLGLPMSLQRDDLLRGMMLGGDGIMGGEAVLKFLEQDVTGHRLTELAATLTERAAALEVLLEEKIKALRMDEEALPLVSSTMKRLTAWREMQAQVTPRDSVDSVLKILRERIRLLQ